MPHAPASSCRANSCGAIVVLPCGARSTPCSVQKRAIVAMLCSSASASSVINGAESHPACDLSALGVPVRWIGRVGDDRFGRLVRDTIAARGVDVSLVEVDPDRPTGLFVKEIAETGTRVRYYRSGSAASAMSAA